METTGKNFLSLYFHIPFCTKKCPYCHFFVIRDNEPQKNLLLEMFFKELSLLNIPKDKSLVSIYFGGGTPSLFEPERIKKLLDYIDSNILKIPSNCEITLEANPENVTLEKMIGFKQAGINRVSLGVQSLHDRSLIQIGRTHSASRAIEAIFHVKHAGIDNISIDLMYDRPNQTLEDWKDELKSLKDLPITHLSLYNMTIEEGSAYKRMEAKIRKQMPEDELSSKLYQTALDELACCGFERYEISAFAKGKQRSIHNLGYWQGRDFYGLGPSAFSYIDKKRFKNVSNFPKYVEKIRDGLSAVDFEESLEPEASLREMLAIGLRVKEGVDLAIFTKKYGAISKLLQKQIDELIQQGLLSLKDTKLCLTELGMKFYDDVGAALV